MKSPWWSEHLQTGLVGEDSWNTKHLLTKEYKTFFFWPCGKYWIFLVLASRGVRLSEARGEGSVLFTIRGIGALYAGSKVIYFWCNRKRSHLPKLKCPKFVSKDRSIYSKLSNNSTEGINVQGIIYSKTPILEYQKMYSKIGVIYEVFRNFGPQQGTFLVFNHLNRLV